MRAIRLCLFPFKTRALGLAPLVALAVSACITGDPSAVSAPVPPPAERFPVWVEDPHAAPGLENTLVASACTPKTNNFAIDRTRLIARTSAALTRAANARAAILLGGPPSPPLFSRADMAGLTPQEEVDVAVSADAVQLCVLMATPEDRARALFDKLVAAYETPPADLEAAYAAFVAAPPQDG